MSEPPQLQNQLHLKAQRSVKGLTAALPAAATAPSLNTDTERKQGGKGKAVSADTDTRCPQVATNDQAERALIQVRKKLRGSDTETGRELRGLSVEAQCERLLALASDPKNLSLMFVGWAPWV